MTYSEMDDDTINELNAEVARQRAEWQQPDPDGHLEESYPASAEEYLTHLAVCVRVYEALKRKEARFDPSRLKSITLCEPEEYGPDNPAPEPWESEQ